MGTNMDTGRGSTAAMLVGAATGLAVGAGLYLLVDPVLEGAGGWVEELQGLSWNLVPGLGIVGAVVGTRWRRHRPR